MEIGAMRPLLQLIQFVAAVRKHTCYGHLPGPRFELPFQVSRQC